MDFQHEGRVDEGLRASFEKKGTAMLSYQATLSAWMIAALVTINLSGLFAIVSDEDGRNVAALTLSAMVWVSGIIFAVVASVFASVNAGYLAAFFLDVAALPNGASFESVRALPSFGHYLQARKQGHLPVMLGACSAMAFVTGAAIMGISTLASIRAG